MMVNHLDALETPDAVDVLVAEYLDALDHGRAPSRSGWLDRHPEHAAALTRFLDDLEQLSPAAVAVDPGHKQMLPGWNGPRGNAACNSGTMSWTTPSTRPGAETLPFGGAFGDYELLAEVGRGGMGVVYKARQRVPDRVVALKMILAGQLADEQHVLRFRAEAQAAAMLDHGGIVPVFEVGEQQGLHYFTMAFVDGMSLAERLHDGPLPPKEAAGLVRDLAAAVAYAHAHGIIHRDLKPANVLIDARGRPKLTDFGLAKLAHGDRAMTGTGQILGTPGYMSPEQARGGAAQVGQQADVYGLGALLFALLTGRPPFQGASPLETIQHVIDAEPPRPRLLNPGVPRDLETICLKCLEKTPGKRYADALALQEELERYLDGRPILARPIGVIEKTYRWYRRRPVLGTMTAALAALLIAVPVLLGFLLVEAEARAQMEADGHDKEKAARAKVEQAHEKTKAAERERTRQLFHAYVNEAAARRSSPRVGRSFVALERIAAARDLADELKLPVEDYVRLRSEAISALSVMDLRGTTTGPAWYLSLQPAEDRYVTGKNSRLAWEKPNHLLVRRMDDDRILQRIPVEHTEWAKNFVYLSSDDRFVSSCVGEKLVVWRVDGKKPVEVVRTAGVLSAMFVPGHAEVVVVTVGGDLLVMPLDGVGEARTVSVPGSTRAALLNVRQTVLRGPWPGPGRQVAVAGKGCVLLIELDTGKARASFPVPGPVNYAAWSPDGALVAATHYPLGVTLFEPATKAQRTVKSTVGGPEFAVFDPSGQLLLTANTWASRGSLVNVRLGTVELRFHYTELGIDPRLEQGGAWWQGTVDGPHRAIPLALGELSNFSNSAVHPSGRLLATATDRGIVLSDLGTGKRLGFLPGVGYGFCDFDAEGDLYAQGYGPGGHVPFRWAVKAKGPRFEIGTAERLNFPSNRGGLAVSADGRFLASGGSAGASVHDRQTGKSIALSAQHDVRYVAIHPSGAQVASFGFWSEGFRLSETSTGKLLQAAGKGPLGGGRFTPDGKYLITRSFGQPTTLWSMPDCKFVRHLGPEGMFDVSPDSRYIAVAEPKGTLRLTRIADGALIARFDAPGEESIGDATFSPDGRYLIGLTVERDRQHVWDLWKLRRQLAELKLDWETQPAPEPVAGAEPIVLEFAPQKAGVLPDKKP